ncbi:toluene ABC transporter permease [Kaistia sp. 32K]|uniref:ABC transporter permease n=1 Tax=Kaistia sp. 32K TaxID=2795690 RepID=UPI001935D16E|nr:MlaE family lipid ABC transporter permease subunit [Kaistia sp. 32K]BCP53127.1 toluene ABC transporter permease [Kaistia sp. 32K]
MATAAATAAQLEFSDQNGQARLRALGPWTVRSVGGLEASIDDAIAKISGATVIDLSGVEHIDTAGAWLITRLERGLRAKQSEVSVEGASENAKRLLEALDPAEREVPPSPAPIGAALELVEAVGRTMYLSWQDLIAGLSLLGGVTRGFVRAVLDPRRFRVTSIVYHIDRTGFRAVPIITLMSLLIGAIISQQSAFQLRAFGAEIFSVDLVGILVLREIGVLLTAIMIAGRSGSAITAEIGSMKMREEIDALSVIGVDPVEVLIMPRIIGLIIALPMLVFLADIAALVGAGLVSWVYIGLPPEAFIDRVRDAVALNTLFVGLIKAPFMALIIGIIAASEGLAVRGSAASLGQHTTAAVVKAIFMVIVVDGLFALYFAAVNY